MGLLIVFTYRLDEIHSSCLPPRDSHLASGKQPLVHVVSIHELG